MRYTHSPTELSWPGPWSGQTVEYIYFKFYFSVANTATVGSTLSSEGILITLELSTLTFNSLVRAKQLFAIRYPNVVIKSLCGNLDICLNYHASFHFRSQNSVRMILIAARDRKWKILFQIVLFGRAIQGVELSVGDNPTIQGMGLSVGDNPTIQGVELIGGDNPTIQGVELSGGDNPTIQRMELSGGANKIG